MFLLDTNIVSATSPIVRARVGDSAFSSWLQQNGQRLFLSAITVAEIEAGIARARRIGATAKAGKLRSWLAAIEHLYGRRILAFGISEAHHAGAIMDRAQGHDPGFEDVAIAATAAASGLTVLTANERHFVPLGVPYLNPLKALPT